MRLVTLEGSPVFKLSREKRQKITVDTEKLRHRCVIEKGLSMNNLLAYSLLQRAYDNGVQMKPNGGEYG